MCAQACRNVRLLALFLILFYATCHGIERVLPEIHPGYTYSGMIGDPVSIIHDQGSDEAIAVLEFTIKHIQHHTNTNLYLYNTTVFDKMDLFYSDDGFNKHLVYTYYQNARHQIPIRLGTNFFLTLQLNDISSSQNVTEIHIATIFRDLDNTFAITEHRWKSSFVPTDKKLNVVSFNIWNYNTIWKTRLQMLEDQIKNELPHILGFQEVRYEWTKAPSRYIPNKPIPHYTGLNYGRFQSEDLLYLKTFKSYQFVFQPAMIYLNLQPNYGDSWHTSEGIAIFSKYNIIETDYLVLSKDKMDQDDGHQRICLRALIEIPTLGKINFYVTHLTLSDPARKKAILEILNFINKNSNQNDPEWIPSIMVGDFNQIPDAQEIQFLKDTNIKLDGFEGGKFVDAWEEMYGSTNEGLSFPTWDPVKRIDFLFVEKNENWTQRSKTGKMGRLGLKDIFLIGNTTLRFPDGFNEESQASDYVSSDHLGVSAKFTIYAPESVPIDTTGDNLAAIIPNVQTLIL